MPATNTRKMTGGFVLGVDGCPKGWLAVRLYPHRDDPQTPELDLFTSFGDLIRSDWGQAEVIMVDIPIGLEKSGRRGCDTKARQLLGPKRGTSVFPAPRRPMLKMDTYAEANKWGQCQGKAAGGGLSKQAWNITPKIREVDETVRPELQNVIREGHPEVAFHRLNGHRPVLEPKRSPAGKSIRINILHTNGLQYIDQVWQDHTEVHGSTAARQDDFIDACALALTGCAIRRNNPVHHLTAGKRDARDLIMEIWG